jgi:hypothetical protein
MIGGAFYRSMSDSQKLSVQDNVEVDRLVIGLEFNDRYTCEMIKEAKGFEES